MAISKLLMLFSLWGMISSSRVPQDYIVGLRAGRSLEDHFAALEHNVYVEQRIPEINGYATPVSDTNEDILFAIRRDIQVGFVVERPRGFFSKDGHVGLEADDLYEYEEQGMWLTLQAQDPEIPVTDDDAT